MKNPVEKMLNAFQITMVLYANVQKDLSGTRMLIAEESKDVVQIPSV